MKFQPPDLGFTKSPPSPRVTAGRGPAVRPSVRGPAGVPISLFILGHLGMRFLSAKKSTPSKTWWCLHHIRHTNESCYNVWQFVSTYLQSCGLAEVRRFTYILLYFTLLRYFTVYFSRRSPRSRARAWLDPVHASIWCAARSGAPLRPVRSSLWCVARSGAWLGYGWVRCAARSSACLGLVRGSVGAWYCDSFRRHPAATA